MGLISRVSSRTYRFVKMGHDSHDDHGHGHEEHGPLFWLVRPRVLEHKFHENPECENREKYPDVPTPTKTTFFGYQVPVVTPVLTWLTALGKDSIDSGTFIFSRKEYRGSEALKAYERDPHLYRRFDQAYPEGRAERVLQHTFEEQVRAQMCDDNTQSWTQGEMGYCGHHWLKILKECARKYQRHSKSPECEELSHKLQACLNNETYIKQLEAERFRRIYNAGLVTATYGDMDNYNINCHIEKKYAEQGIKPKGSGLW